MHLCLLSVHAPDACGTEQCTNALYTILAVDLAVLHETALRISNFNMWNGAC